MLQLLTLRLSIAAWKTTLEISSKLRARTWALLAIVHVCIAAISFWAYQAKSVSESEIPSVQLVQLDRSTSSEEDITKGYYSFYAWGSTSWGSTSYDCWSPISVATTGMLTPYSHLAISDSANRGHTFIIQNGGSEALRLEMLPEEGRSFSVVIIGTDFQNAYGPFEFNSDNFRSRLPQMPDSDRTVIVPIPSEAPDLFAPTERRVMLLTSILATLLALISALSNIQQNRRRREERILIELQIRELKARLDIMERERLRQIEEDAKSPLILIS